MQTSTEQRRPLDAPASQSSSIMSPTLPIRVIHPNPNLEIAFDVRTRNPVYVLEKLVPQQLTNAKNISKRRRPRFYEESSLEPIDYRSRLSNYKNSGWDRGHMAPAADFPESMEDTFNLCNVSPQNHMMNISIWSRIEEWIRRLAISEETATTYAVTGPLWLPTRQINDTEFQYSYLGLGRPPSLVSVPTHFFKVVVVVEENDNCVTIRRFACFVVPNCEPDKNKSLEHYVVPWTDLETVTGLQFFSKLVDAEWKAWADQMTKDQVLKQAASSQPRILTDGSKRSSRRTKIPKEIQQTLRHLCVEGQCRR